MTEKEMMDRSIQLVRKYFGDNHKKVTAWFSTPNPHFGGASPNELFKAGRAIKVLKFVESALDENEK